MASLKAAFRLNTCCRSHILKCPIYTQQSEFSHMSNRTFNRKEDEKCFKRVGGFPITSVNKTFYNFASGKKRPRLDRVGHQHRNKFAEIQDLIGSSFNTEGFFNGVAETFIVITNLLNDGRFSDLQHLLSDGAYYYAEWLREESVHNVTAYNEVIFPIEEKDIFSLMINDIEIDHEDDETDVQTNRDTTFYIKVTVTYGKKNHRVIFGIPDSYSCSFAVFVFKRTLHTDDGLGDWQVDRLQYYPPR